MRLKIALPGSSEVSAEDLTILCRTIVQAYRETEADLFREFVERTTVRELSEIIGRGEFVLARWEGRVVGGCYLRERESGTFEYGMLACDPELQGKGIGRELIAFSENVARSKGGLFMLADVLYPADDSTHAYKDFLIDFYNRLGYEISHEIPFDAKYARVKGKMAKPCKLIIMKKSLTSCFYVHLRGRQMPDHTQRGQWLPISEALLAS